MFLDSKSMEYKHTPVMLNEVLEYLAPKRGGYFIDCTLGGGGYTIALSQIAGNSGKILAIDLDKDAISNAKTKKLKNVIFANDNFSNLSEIIKEKFGEDTLFDGIVLDLGLSSYQLEDNRRGFSFRVDSAPLDMSFNQDNVDKTKEIINKASEKELEKIIREYGEEKNAYKIAREIVNTRKDKIIETAGELKEAVERVTLKKDLNKKIHPVTKTFQALRIATNEELESLRQVLPQAISHLKKGGKLIVVSFHSLEDRIVKHFFKQEARECVCPPKLPVCRCDHQKILNIITKKIVIASEDEIKKNPRSRSAKMRVAQKL